MKRTALFCLLLALLTGCAHTPDVPSPSVFPEAPGKADVENFYAAAAQVYDWFTLTTLPLDASDSRTENGQTYYRVDCQSLPLPALHVSSLADSTTAYAAPPVTLSSLADLQSLVESYFSPELRPPCSRCPRTTTGTLTACSMPRAPTGAATSICWTRPCRQRRPTRTAGP